MAEQGADYARKFLVVIDDTPECDRAVTFVAHRVRRTGGTVVLLTVIDTADFQQFIGVEEVMRAEARQEAEQNLDVRIARINAIGPTRIETAIREGRPADQIEALIAADHGIAILVLGAGTSGEGPGPLVSHFATRAHALPVILTIVPGAMSDADIEALC